MEKYKKSHTKKINLNNQPQRGIKNFNYLMGHILHPIFCKEYFANIIIKHQLVTNNPTIRIYVKLIENRITYKK